MADLAREYEDLRTSLAAARSELELADNMHQETGAALQRARSQLALVLDAIQRQRVSALPPCDAPVSEHRKQHRPGKMPKIASDSELQAFILARIDRLTYEEIAADVAEHFPPERRVARSTIHEWWKNRSK